MGNARCIGWTPLRGYVSGLSSAPLEPRIATGMRSSGVRKEGCHPAGRTLAQPSTRAEDPGRAMNSIFENLFVLELANNHWGSVDRGTRIIRDFSQLARFNNVRACIKFQFRNVDTFIHKDFRERSDIR